MPPKSKKLIHADQNLSQQISKLSKQVNGLASNALVATTMGATVARGGPQHVAFMKAQGQSKKINRQQNRNAQKDMSLPASHRPTAGSQAAAYQQLKDHYSSAGGINYQPLDGNATSYQLAKAAQSRAFGEAVDLDDLNMGKSSKYLKAIVDPEGSGRNAGVPDSYTEPTFRYQSISEIGLSTNLFSEDGLLPIITCPHVSSHIFLPTVLFGPTMSIVSMSSDNSGHLYDKLFFDPVSASIQKTELKRVKFVADSKADSYPYTGSNQVVVFNPFTVNANNLFANTAAVYSSGLFRGKFNGAKSVDEPIDGSSNSDATMWPEATSNNAGNILSLPYAVNAGGVLNVGIAMGNANGLDLGASNIRIRGSVNVDYVTSGYSNVPNTADPWRIFAFFCTKGIDANGLEQSFSAQSSNYIDAGVGLNFCSNFNFVWTDSSASSIVPGGSEFLYNSTYNALNSPSANADRTNQPTGIICMTDWSIDFLAIRMNAATPFTAPVLQAVSAFTNYHSIKISYTPLDTGDAALPTVYIKPVNTLSGGGPGTVTPGSIIQARRCPELGIFNDGFTTGIRLVSMSTWVMYVGGTLNDVGIIHSNFVYDRRVVTDRDHSYVTEFGLTNMGNSYRGKAPLGCYSIWKPMHERDIEFMPFDSEWTWNMPYNVCILNAGGAQQAPNAAAENYSLRVVANWELITLAPLLRNGLVMSVVDPDQITNMFRVLQGFPMCMANDDHVGAIKSFFSNLWSGVKAVYKGPGRSIVKAVAPEFLPLGDFLTSL